MNLSLTPSGHLRIVSIASPDASDGGTGPLGAETIARAFAASPSAGIMALAGGKAAADWPLSWLFWRDFGARYLLLLCHCQPTAARLEPTPPLDAATLATLTLSIPPMPGAEYATPEVFTTIWAALDTWALASGELCINFFLCAGMSSDGSYNMLGHF